VAIENTMTQERDYKRKEKVLYEPQALFWAPCREEDAPLSKLPWSAEAVTVEVI
jgi:hypothetical protein